MRIACAAASAPSPCCARTLPHSTCASARWARATALFSVWADSHGPSTFDEVRESYSLAAADVGGVYLPVNEAWSLAWDRQSTLRLYSSDGFHPSEEGSYLAALVMVGVLAGASP